TVRSRPVRRRIQRQPLHPHRPRLGLLDRVRVRPLRRRARPGVQRGALVPRGARRGGIALKGARAVLEWRHPEAPRPSPDSFRGTAATVRSKAFVAAILWLKAQPPAVADAVLRLEPQGRLL